MTDFLSGLIDSSPRPVTFTSFPEWWQATAGLRERAMSTVDRAIALGYAADRVGVAFAGGYTSATRRLDRRLTEEPAAFCVTEDEGGHPRAIHARLEGDTVWGAKRFVSLGPWARTLLVVAAEGTAPAPDGRRRLKVVRVSARAPGVTITEGPPLEFIPEIPHASVTLDGARGEVLPGDGYGDYVKPFRSIEDVHVASAVLGYVLRQSLTGRWPEPFSEQVLAALCAAQSLGHDDLTSEVSHLAIAGFLALVHRLTQEAVEHWLDDSGARQRFLRDLPLLDLARHAREARRQRAWELVASE